MREFWMPTEHQAARTLRGPGMRTAAVAPILAAIVLLSGCGEDGGHTVRPPANSPPTITAQRDTSCVIGDTLRLQAQAQDADGDSLEFSASITLNFDEWHSGYRPAGGMNARSGAFWFAPKSGDGPSRQVEFFVDDGRGGRDSTAFLVVVP